MSRRTGPLASLVAATLAAAAAGCQAVEPAPGATPPAEAPADVQGAVANLAIETLAAELKIPKDAITVESVTEIDWRNSSLGCPKPGMAYLDVITSGHKVTLRANGQVYSVHEADNKAFVCHQPSLAGGMAPKPELAYGRLMLTAQKDLAQRLRVPVQEIRPGGAMRMTWENAALGCPEPGKQYAEAETDGWRLTLKHGQREYIYHADDHHVIPCPAIAAE
jgi:hypothetical protein